MSYEIQHRTELNGWVNTWHDESGNPWIFETREAACEELGAFFAGVAMARANGVKLKDYRKADFKVIKVKPGLTPEEAEEKLRKAEYVRLRKEAGLQMLKIPPEEWAARVAKIAKKSLRAAIANIVWWDFFGDRIVSKEWNHLAPYLAEYNYTMSVSPDELIAALAAVGYPSGAPFYIAEKRAAGIELSA